MTAPPPAASAGAERAHASGLVAPERVIARLRPHARMLFWPTLFLLFAAGASTAVPGRFEQPWVTPAVLVLCALIAVAWLAALLGWLGQRYTVTTRRLIVRSGFFVRSRQEVLHSRGYGMTVRQSWLQQAFRSGDIVLAIAPDSRLVLHDAPQVAVLHEALADLVEENRALLSAGREAARTPEDGGHTAIWGGR